MRVINVRVFSGLYGILKEPRILAGVVILLSMILVSSTSLIIGLADPFRTMVSKPLQQPSITHLAGTDALGRDLLSRIFLGILISLFISLLGTVIAFLLGLPMGFISAIYRGSRIDDTIMRIVDSLLAFPALVLVLFINASFGQGPLISSIAIGIAEAPIVARLSRGTMIGVLSNQFVEAAVAIGAGKLWIIAKYLLPHSSSVLITHFTLTLSAAIILESGLSFLGLSTSPPVLSLGGIVREGFLYLETAWWYSLIPSMFLVLLVLSVSLIGDGLNDALDPRYKVSREYI